MLQNRFLNARFALPVSALAILLAFGCVHAVATDTAVSPTVSDSISDGDDASSPVKSNSDAAASPSTSSTPEATTEAANKLEETNETSDSARNSLKSADEDISESAEVENAHDDSGQSIDACAMSPEERRTHLAKMTTPAALDIPNYDIGMAGDTLIEDELEELEDAELSDDDMATSSCSKDSANSEVAQNRPGVRYSADISDDDLAKLWRESPEELGALSIGIPSLGRVVNSKQFPEGEDWIIVNPSRTYGTEETINYLLAAIGEVTRQYPDGPSLIRINDIGMPHGGHLKPHQSHQAGRDVDLSFYYGSNGPDRGPWAVDHNFDLDRNWALIRAFITETDVQVILVDGGIAKRLFNHALKKGEDRAWLDSIFHQGTKSIVRAARGHRDHFHVRFYNPRAQELGRRVLPLIPKDPSQNLRYHKVAKGDTIGKIAFTFGSTIKAIQQANKLKGTMIRVGDTLAVPMRGPCVNCPMPPEVVIPPRRMPPQTNSPLLASKAPDRNSRLSSPSGFRDDEFLMKETVADNRHTGVWCPSDENKTYDLADYLMPWTQFQTGITL